MRWIFFCLVFFAAAVSFFYFLFGEKNIISPLGKPQEKKVKPLEKYAFENLRKARVFPSTIKLIEPLKETDSFISYLFSFQDGPKVVTGLLNVPKSLQNLEAPVIVMFRGFVEKEIFTTGEGTRRTGEEFARNGFITLAPDFLGYGKSDKPSNLSIEERFQTYTTSISLMSSLTSLNQALSATTSAHAKADLAKIGIWGHSNGGHITLSILAITGRQYPTVLWNPVTKPFPYSILYFTDEFDDHGKALRKVVAEFEKDYDAELYSPTNYYKWIEAPIQLHQAIDDEAVPIRWSNQFYTDMKKLEKNIVYFIYPGENHNFNLGSWNLAIARSIEFYRNQFSK